MQQSVFLVIHDVTDDTIICQRNPKHGLHLIGGKVEAGETLVHALLREFSEEVHLFRCPNEHSLVQIGTTNAHGYDQTFFICNDETFINDIFYQIRYKSLQGEYPLEEQDVDMLNDNPGPSMGSTVFVDGLRLLNDHLDYKAEELAFYDWRSDMQSNA